MCYRSKVLDRVAQVVHVGIDIVRVRFDGLPPECCLAAMLKADLQELWSLER